MDVKSSSWEKWEAFEEFHKKERNNQSCVFKKDYPCCDMQKWLSEARMDVGKPGGSYSGPAEDDSNLA